MGARPLARGGRGTARERGKHVTDKTAFDYINEAREGIADVDEVTLVVLKGHLQIEHAIDRVIQSAVSAPKYINNLQLNFDRKAKLCRSFAGCLADSPTWGLIKSINSLRNKLLHNLKNRGMESHIRNIIKTAKDEFPESFESDTRSAKRDFQEAVSLPVPFLDLVRVNASVRPVPGTAEMVRVLTAFYQPTGSIADDSACTTEIVLPREVQRDP